ncbi:MULTISPECIES: tRNA (adenine(9)-N1)-methyltransferase Trm10 [Metallosphaera]|uniref:tRNA (adenine(9)-N1)-methyltransferase Trm10 n=1 Tax=Metallosphaera TaxID=41980 RepID=UPI001F05511C|nr:tRNA (adenine(9)-N1)-methyltransferase Trm10 [Metallosphaera sedula]MCH1770150.1 tRNA (guanine-N1)-methyltransferase [Metallosphaera sedula]MCP6728016.1 tRNA (guanine-N1)-methyltransferase [Metallosphaera sedula]
MILGRALGKQLQDSGIDTLYVRGLRRPFLQHTALKLVLYNWGIRRGIFYGRKIVEEYGISFLGGKGTEIATDTPHPQGDKFPFQFPSSPLFMIDFSLWDRHSQDEKRKLVSQILMVISTLRKYLWDYNLSLNHTTQELEEMLMEVSFFNKVRRNVEPFNAIVLDPYGEREATEDTLRSADTFILGGIVDDSGWKYATRELTEIAGYHQPRVKIVLRGSRVGVPDRLNRIVSIVLRVREGQSLEESILAEQSNADKFARLLRDTTLNGDLEGNAQWLRAGDKLRERVKKIISRTQPGSSSSPR